MRKFLAPKKTLTKCGLDLPVRLRASGGGCAKKTMDRYERNLPDFWTKGKKPALLSRRHSGFAEKNPGEGTEHGK
ncbi:hypothetical protein RB195_011742 [Necator americanus]|uniref:Uncharacterized protein n=1 Tax=Necator americanus TaxID=51031 RepID=A0ABR1D3U2_NECAM